MPGRGGTRSWRAWRTSPARWSGSTARSTTSQSTLGSAGGGRFQRERQVIRGLPVPQPRSRTLRDGPEERRCGIMWSATPLPAGDPPGGGRRQPEVRAGQDRRNLREVEARRAATLRGRARAGSEKGGAGDGHHLGRRLGRQRGPRHSAWPGTGAGSCRALTRRRSAPNRQTALR